MTEKPMKKDNGIYSVQNIVKAILFSGFGIFSVFIPITINGSSSILLDHVNTFISNTFPAVMKWFAMAMVVIGVVLPFVRKTWNKTRYSTFFSLVGILAIPTAIMFVLNRGPAFLMVDSIIPTLYNTIIIPWSLVILTGSICIAFLSNFGLFEFVGVFARPIMRKVFKLPGMAAVNCLACFMGSFTVGSLVTNNLYKEGRYSRKEGIILLTGFGTVSATFMMIQARVGAVTEIWTLFFWGAFVTTLVVSAITCRLWPVCAVPDTYYTDPKPEVVREGSPFKNAVEDGLTTCAGSPSPGKTLLIALKQAFFMIWGLMPIMGSLAAIALCILQYTPIFDFVAYIFYPFTWLIQLPNPMLAAKAVGFTLVDTVLSCGMVGAQDMATRFVVCVTSVSQIIFFCGSLPSFLSTDLEFSLPKYMLVAVERIILSVVVAGLLAIVLF